MTLDDIKKFFGSGYQFSKVSGMSHTNYISWKRKGFVPMLAQHRLEEITGRKLKADYQHGEGRKSMLTKAEITKLLEKKEELMPDNHIMLVAKDWDLTHTKVTVGILGLSYSYIKHKYVRGETVYDMERNLGIAKESISRALRILEAHGYVTISRSNKPFSYAVIK